MSGERQPSRPRRVFLPQPAPGSADWVINDIRIGNICGDCGQEFQISKDDPHWSTGRGPICPNPR